MKDSNPYPDTVSDSLWKKASAKEREFIRQHEEQHRRVKMTNKVQEAMYDEESALWKVQLEEFPDSVRCSRQEIMDTWILQGTTQFKAGAALKHGILNALMNNPIGVFYTCHDGQDYGYRYGTDGCEYYSFYMEV